MLWKLNTRSRQSGVVCCIVTHTTRQKQNPGCWRFIGDMAATSATKRNAVVQEVLMRGPYSTAFSCAHLIVDNHLVHGWEPNGLMSDLGLPWHLLRILVQQLPRQNNMYITHRRQRMTGVGGFHTHTRRKVNRNANHTYF